LSLNLRCNQISCNPFIGSEVLLDVDRRGKGSRGISATLHCSQNTTLDVTSLGIREHNLFIVLHI